MKTKLELLERLHEQNYLEVLHREIEVKMFTKATIRMIKPEHEQIRQKLEALKVTQQQEISAYTEKLSIIEEMMEEAKKSRLSIK